MPIARLHPIARLPTTKLYPVPAVKVNAFPLHAYSEDKSHACGVALRLPVTANTLEADSGTIATVSHDTSPDDSTNEGPGRHRARVNCTSTTTTTTTDNDVDSDHRREDPDPAAERCSLRRDAEGLVARAESSDETEIAPSCTR